MMADTVATNSDDIVPFLNTKKGYEMERKTE